MRVKLVDLMPFHPLLRHPHTGEPLKAIFQREDGTYVWPLLGADDDGGGDDGDDADNDSDGDENEDADDDNSDDDDKDEKAKSKSKSKKNGPVSREEFDALTNRLSRADKRRSDAEKEAADLRKFKDEAERKGNTELDNTKKDLTTISKDHETLKGKFAKLARVNAFLTASAQEKISWHDPEVAQRAADLEELEIDEDGKVEGIRDAVKALAKSKKFLVKTEDDSDDDEDSKTRTRRSGNGVGSAAGKGKGKQEKGKLTDEQLRARFPALNR